MLDGIDSLREIRRSDGPVDHIPEFAEELFTELRRHLDAAAVGGTADRDGLGTPVRWRRSVVAAIVAIASILLMGGLLWLAPTAQPDGEFEPIRPPLPEPNAADGAPSAGVAPPVTFTAPVVVTNPEGYRFAGWKVVPSGQFEGRRNAAAVWTGSQLIVWGGERPGAGTRPEGGWPLADGGGAFNPAAGFWVELPPAPFAGRAKAAALWTGQEMLIVGGSGEIAGPGGAAYDPGTQTWRELAAADVPPEAAAVWTGDEALMWSGGDSTGAAYDPQTDTWRTLSTSLGIDWRPGAEAVWTGSEMIVWNDVVRGSDLAATTRAASDIGAYDPSSDGWRRFAPFADELELSAVTGIWTGEELILWGTDLGREIGREEEPALAGIALDPVTERWRVIAPAPFSAFEQFSEFGADGAVWSGSRMLVWVAATQTEGPEIWSYDPDTDVWESGAGTPLGGADPTLLWTGETLFTFGRSYFVPLARMLTVE